MLPAAASVWMRLCEIMPPPLRSIPLHDYFCWLPFKTSLWNNDDARNERATGSEAHWVFPAKRVAIEEVRSDALERLVSELLRWARKQQRSIPLVKCAGLLQLTMWLLDWLAKGICSELAKRDESSGGRATAIQRHAATQSTAAVPGRAMNMTSNITTSFLGLENGNTWLVSRTWRETKVCWVSKFAWKTWRLKMTKQNWNANQSSLTWQAMTSRRLLHNDGKDRFYWSTACLLEKLRLRFN